MNGVAPQASKKCGLLPPDHQRIASGTSNAINAEQVLTIPSKDDIVEAEAVHVREGGVR